MQVAAPLQAVGHWPLAVGSSEDDNGAAELQANSQKPKANSQAPSAKSQQLTALFIILIHCDGDACQAEALGDVARSGELLLDDGFVLGAELTQHEVGLCATGKVVADAELQTGIALTDELGDVLQTVVTAVAALASQTQGAHGKREVVDDDEEVLGGDVLLLQPVAHGIAAEVHEGGGLEQRDLCVLHTHVGHEAVALVFPHGACRTGKGVYHAKSDVVACAVVLIARVTQADNQVFHFIN